MLAILPSLIIPASMADLDTDGKHNCKQDKPRENDSGYLYRLIHDSALHMGIGFCIIFQN